MSTEEDVIDEQGIDQHTHHHAEAETAGAVRGLARSLGRSSGVVGRSAGRSVGRSAGKTVGKTVGRTVGRTAGRSAGSQVGKSVGRTAGRSAGRQVGKSVGKQVGKSVGKEVGKSIGKEAGKSATRSAAGRAASRLPGKLHHRSAANLRRVPNLRTREVAKVSDRLSTGYDWWSLAVESSPDDSPISVRDKPAWWRRAGTFSMSLVKNTLLGMAVYESYGYTVGLLAPPPVVPHEFSETQNDTIPPNKHQEFSLDDKDDFQLHEMNDEYARASLLAHSLAGGVGGSVQGVGEALMEKSVRRLPVLTLHHGFSHAILFGSYESLKRVLMPHREVFAVEESQQLGILASFTLAGGLAGQLQYVVSHYSDQLLLGSNQAYSKTRATGSNLSRSAAFLWRNVTHPAMRPTLTAFLPGAIGFVAFEYGKQIMTG